MRLFFALWPNDAERTALVNATRAAVEACGGRAVPRENLHLTLAFLGSLPQERLPALLAMAAVVRSTAFALVIDRIEHFRRSRVLAATPSRLPAAASALAAVLRERLLVGGFTPDLKPFRAHLTLSREITRARESAAMDPVRLECAEFALVESRTESSGAIYSVLRSWSLYGAGSA